MLWLLLLLCLLPGSASAASSFGSSDVNVPIPDAGGTVSSEIVISDAPPDARVTSVGVAFIIVHEFPTDLIVKFGVRDDPFRHILWNRFSGNPAALIEGIQSFNGRSVNGIWRLDAQDLAALDVGFIDSWAIQLFYADSDTDGDGRSDATDNCRFFWNPGQEDLDGDGIGDVCQCGDLDFDSEVTPADVDLLRRALADPLGEPLSEEARQRCIVIGPIGPCSMLHAVIMARSALGLGPAVDDGCQIFDSSVDNDLDGWSELEGDCDDINPSVFPGAAEVCDGLDNDCDTIVDEGFDLASDPENCGSCGQACAAGDLCQSGVCAPPPSCGDGVRNQTSEECDGADAAACPGLCLAGCRCAPDLRGFYSGTATHTQSGCQDPAQNLTFTGVQSTLQVSAQSGGDFNAALRGELTFMGFFIEIVIDVTGTVDASGRLAGSFTSTQFTDFEFDSSGSGTFTGQLAAGGVTLTAVGQDTVGDTCSFQTQVQLSRP